MDDVATSVVEVVAPGRSAAEKLMPAIGVGAWRRCGLNSDAQTGRRSTSWLVQGMARLRSRRSTWSTSGTPLEARGRATSWPRSVLRRGGAGDAAGRSAVGADETEHGTGSAAMEVVVVTAAGADSEEQLRDGEAWDIGLVAKQW